MRAVRAGGDRQDAHERIRGTASPRRGRSRTARRTTTCSTASPRDDAFGITRDELERAMDPSRFVGRAPEQVDEFLAEVVEPLLAGGRRRSGRSRRCAYERAPSCDASLPLPLLRRGKVRDVYEVDEERLLLVASDRVSAFDVVMNERVPHKGAVLTQITAWWLRAARPATCRTTCSPRTPTRSSPRCRRSRRIARRSRARDAVPPHDVFPVECVVRGYLTGSAWKEYRATGTLAGEPLPAGLRGERPIRSARFSRPRRRRPGHDENITDGRDARVSSVSARPRQLERMSRRVYARGRDLAAARGIIIADTKFEFGRDRDRHDPADRRSAHAGQLALLARRPLRARSVAAELRQAAAARLSRRRAARRTMERRGAAAATAGGGGRGDEPSLSRCLSAPHRCAARPRRTFDPHTVSFAREGLVFIAIAALIAAGTYALALNRRSWPLWLLAFLLTVITLFVAYFFRDPVRTSSRGERGVIASASRNEGERFEQRDRSRLNRSGSRMDMLLPLNAPPRLYVNVLPPAGTNEIVDLVTS